MYPRAILLHPRKSLAPAGLGSLLGKFSCFHAISPHLFIGYLAEPLLIRLSPHMLSWTLFLGANTFSIKQALQKLMRTQVPQL